MKSTSQIVFSVTVITLLSRVLSLASLQLYMSFFGPQNLYLNIYSFALGIPNIIFNCIGTAITAVVVPIYSSLLVKKEILKAEAFLNDIITISCMIILLLVSVGFFAAPFIAGFTHYRYDQESFEFLVFSLRVLMPAMFFYGLNYIFQGILHSNGRFKLPAFVTTPSSLVVISYVLLFGHAYGVRGLLFATVFGLSLQAFVLLPSIIKMGYRYKPSINLKSEEMKTAAKLTLPVLVSVSSFQINMFFNTTLATRFNTVTIMGYVQNLILVIILSIVYSITAVYFPKLTELWSINNKDEYKSTLNNIIMVVIFLLMPATAGFVILRFELINLLAQWGDFDEYSAILAANMFGIYGLGIIFVGLKEVLDKAFYSQKNSKTPAIFGFIIMAVNISFSLFFIDYLGTFSMPMAYSVSTFVGALGLILVMNRKVRIIDKDMIVGIIKCLISSVIMFLVLQYIMPQVRGLSIGGEFITRSIRLFLPVGVGVIVYFLMAFVLKIKQAEILFSYILKRRS